MKTINAKGNTTDPVAMTKAEVDRGETQLAVLLDNPISASNVVRFLENMGFGVKLNDDEGAITISARKGEQLPKPAAFKKQTVVPVIEAQPTFEAQSLCQTPSPGPLGTFSVLITRCALGHDQELGEALMKNFLGTLAQMERPPLVVSLMNDGVKLALYDSTSCDYLKNLEKKGVSVLISGVCVNHFSIMDQVGAGSISNMFEIIESLNMAEKIMTL